MVYINAIWKQAVHNTYLLSYPSCSTRATQNQKYISHRNILVNILEKKVGRMDHLRNNDKTERARWLGREKKKWAQEIGSGNQMRSPRFQTSDIPGLHWGDSEERGDNPKLSVAPYVWSKSEYISQCEWAGRGADQNRHHMVTGKNEEQIRTDILWWHGRKRGRSKQTSHGDREGRGADQNTHHIIFLLLLSV